MPETITECPICHMPSTPMREIHYEACPYHDLASCPTCNRQSPRSPAGVWPVLMSASAEIRALAA